MPTVQEVEATVWGATKALATSKKFQAAILSALIWILAKVGVHADAADLIPVVGPIWLYIFGQSIADLGKSSAQIAANSNAPTTSTQVQVVTNPPPAAAA